MKLLAHVTYFDGGTTAGVSAKTSALKTSTNWREFNFFAVLRLLDEMECRYVAFGKVDVTIDVNDANAYQHRLPEWRSFRKDACGTTMRVNVSIAVHRALSHPFRLAWAHREHMLAMLEEYDWFLSLEGDTLVPARAMDAQIALATPLYRRHNMVLGFTRVVNDTQGRSFFSDIVRSASRNSVLALDGLGKFVTPTNTYAAVWAYPRNVMRAFVHSADWSAQGKSIRGMRERAAWGWRHSQIVTLVDNSALRIYHLGKSGPYLVRERGHNSWPVDRLVE